MAKSIKPSKQKTAPSKPTNSKSSGLLIQARQNPFQVLFFILGFIIIGFIISRIFAATPPVSLCTATAVCVTPGTDLCDVITGAQTGQTIVVRGDSTQPYKIGQCTVSSPNIPDIAKLPKNITLTADAGSRPVLDGILSLYKADGWTVKGFTFMSTAQVDSLLTLIGGDGWRITSNEFYGGGGFSQIQVGHNDYYGNPVNWTVDHNYLHDNPGNTAHEDVQDHLLYVIGGVDFNMKATVTDNFFIGSVGPSVKFGSSSLADGDGTSGIYFARNTLYNKSRKGYNLIIATRSSNIQVENNTIYGEDSRGVIREVVPIQLGIFAGSGIKISNNNIYGYDTKRKPPVSVAYTGQASFQNRSFELNESGSGLAQAGNVSIDPGFPRYNGRAMGCTAYPPTVSNGVTYGASPCTIGSTTIPTVVKTVTPSPKIPSASPSPSPKPVSPSPVISAVLSPSPSVSTLPGPTNVVKQPATKVNPFATPTPVPSNPNATDKQPPTVPKNIKLALNYNLWQGACSVKTACSLTLSWDKSTDNIGIKGYQIYRSYFGINRTTIGSTLNGKNSFTDLTVLPNRPYQYEVVAIDTSGNRSAGAMLNTVITCAWVVCSPDLQNYAKDLNVQLPSL